MTSKFELSISTEYVPDWGLVEAFRELFQNALDNEIMNPENKMGWKYDASKQEVVISNKTSKLETGSLLLGSGTKHDRTDTIGKHGEGYKIAFMVLLRNNKTILVENYGLNEIWEVKLVKSRKYKGKLVPTVFVNKEPIWKKKPSSDLTIIVGGISEEEYAELVKKNLHLQNDVESITTEGYGSVLLNEKESGNIYVDGLFIAHKDGFKYGYNFPPNVISLDRDRKLVDSFDVKWHASSLWSKLSDTSDEARKIATELVMDRANDTAYISSMSYSNAKLVNSVADKFYTDNGKSAVPVTSNIEYEAVEKEGLGKPVIVTSELAEVLRSNNIEEESRAIKIVSVQEQLRTFIDKIADRLSDDELNEINELIDKVNN